MASFLSTIISALSSVLPIVAIVLFSLIALLSMAGAVFCGVFLFLIAPCKKRKDEALEFLKYKYAHRGLHSDTVAENSLTAFRLAVEGGYGIELDVRLSRDGELVVFHDDTLDRVTDATGNVKDKDYAELSAIKLSGTEDTIPTFADVLRLVDGRVPLLIELKEASGEYGVTEKTIEVLSGYTGKYMIESFNPLALGRVKKKMPNVIRGVLSMNFFKEKKYHKPTYFLLQNLLLNIVCRPDFIAYDHEQHKNLAFSLCKFLFRPVTVAWTIKSKEEEAKAFEHGFAGIIFEGYSSENPV